MAPLEAIVTLTPLSISADFRRTFKLGPSRTTVIVGRASKNADKGLVANVDNAWFDSPIMSRKHASFSLSSDSQHASSSLSSDFQQAIYLQDYKSTHGTFISGRRLLNFENVRLKDWDVITFGVKITAGAETYPPRSFTFNVKWQNRSNPFYPTISTANRSFRLPDDDNDSSSDISRDSLAIVDSHPRTFSVPSSDDEDDECIALTNHMPGKELGRETSKTSTNRATIPLSSTRLHSEASADKGSNKHVAASIHDSMGASQKNPIDLDRGHEHAIDIDSDDDGPEILPIDHSITVTEEKIVGPHGEPPSIASQNLWSPACQDADADSTASQYGDDEDFFRDLDKIQVQDTQAQTIEPRPAGSYVSFDLPSLDSMTDPRDPFDNEFTQRPVEISRTGSTEGLDSTQRPSSPSDAALAKKSVPPVDSDNNLRYFEGVQRDGGQKALKVRISEKPRNHFTNEKLDSVKFAREQHAGAQAQRHEINESAIGQTNLRYGDVAMTAPYQSKPYYSDDLGVRNEGLKSYSTGPFATLPEYKPFKPGYSDFYSGPKQDDSYTHTDLYPNSYYSTVWNDPHWDTRAHKPASEDDWKRPHNVPTSLEPYFVAPPPPPPPKMPLQDKFCSPYENPPRVKISNLVNLATPTSRGQKRKADDMNKEETTQAPTEAASPLFPEASQNSVILPDAQPQDQPTMPETSLSQETSKTQDTNEPASQKAFAILATEDGPARKKAKTSPSKAAGIGKFVSGIAVGVVGVLATFIATIPASVREEALREMNNIA